MPSQPDKDGPRAIAQASLRQMNRATKRERRTRFRETTMGERLEAAFELSELSGELRRGLGTR
ncbi:MAG: hypothetical protein M3355_04335 [Actinomycetota bacterium]|nr:hypothetical protein [Actinomycetota bacterium]